VASGGLELHYQPLHALADGALAGFEALARWRHGGRLVPAAEFIPLAEESDLIRLLDWRVLRQVLQEASAVLPAGSPLHVAVNLSARSLQAPGLVDHVATLLVETGFPAARLMVEVTESAAIRQAERSFATLGELARLGVRLAMDDFGTGFASLTYLRNMPLHRVKIDGSLIRQLGIDPRGEELVRGAIGLGHGLGLEVVGEGIETEEQRDWLRRHGCDLGQGYLLGHPVPGGELKRLLGVDARSGA
jgi:EAL domain-containing protein (putative c-di-GMP-specific phosphodiesterase class I)